MKPAKCVVEIWQWGGASHLEGFDPKPDAGRDYNGGLKAIPTNVPGMEIHEWWPELAKCADLYSVIRSMTHTEFGHETATYLMQTGRLPGGGEVCPAIGAVIAEAKRKDYAGDLPPYVILTRAKGRFSEVGFLGDAAAPLVTGGRPNAPRFTVDGIVPPAGVSAEAAAARFDLLRQLDAWAPADAGNVARAAAFDAAGKEARRIAEGDAAQVFDLSRETEETRLRYGRNEIGQSLLAARRLVEYGVPYVTVNVPGWDSHKRHFETMKRRTADMDRGLAAFLTDLKAKGLLDSTVVWMSASSGGRRRSAGRRRGTAAAGTLRAASPRSSPAAGSRAAASSVRPTKPAACPRSVPSRRRTFWAASTSGRGSIRMVRLRTPAARR